MCTVHKSSVWRPVYLTAFTMQAKSFFASIGLVCLVTLVYIYIYKSKGSLGIVPTRNCTHFLKNGFVVAVGGFYSYYIHQGNKSDKEKKFQKK